MDMLPIKRGVLSVTDKSGLAAFASELAGFGVELISTGGTRKALKDAGLTVKSVSEVTGFPEIMGGRVKTLHPNVHGGVLADKDNPEHMSTLDKHGIKTIDMVCVNLYNFAKAVSEGQDLRSAVEQIDIGGPTMLRAAAKNFHSVLVVPSPVHYPRILKEMKNNDGKISLALRKELAAETFALVSEYDSMIAKYLAEHDA
ncbi:phosphoribosylaminoimidazolecarboxamide formyltransferase / IMP cyclohydrolase [Maridesulfovibrio ferrireducens]|uniref:Phosphoribosylaminoimidazolecarboxamide formyltransferase / IMP cyclohydrolase n=1 Tax=Maridesulfovibrio ferrireducens TaxID=246191 RepID=A0A1G9F9T6_9BACT|nr:IMP cyclohydrolase [Maridesulfovibrio ferrireducens]SDK85136.1 phosphoribosylaminoimidazolecarboxamide formyltransferase / IMP cyclohydrolase [Maridesulfovibrio ferrireducens]